MFAEAGSRSRDAFRRTLKPCRWPRLPNAAHHRVIKFTHELVGNHLVLAIHLASSQYGRAGNAVVIKALQPVFRATLALFKQTRHGLAPTGWPELSGG